MMRAKNLSSFKALAFSIYFIFATHYFSPVFAAESVLNQTPNLDLDISTITATGGGILLHSRQAASPSGLYIDTSNNIGIGTRTPTQKLEVAGSLQLNGSLIGLNNQTFNISSGGDQGVLSLSALGGAGIELRGNNVSYGGKVLIDAGTYNPNGDPNFRDPSIYLRTYNAAGNAKYERIKVSGYAERGYVAVTAADLSVSGNITISGLGNGLTFADGTTQTTASAGSSTISAANVSSGQFGSNTGGGNFTFPANVGIGTTTPTSLLQLVDNVNGLGHGLRLTTSKADSESSIRFDNDVRSWVAGVRQIGAAGADHFFVHDFTSGNDRLVIDTTGNVGIGISSPDQKLDIRGQIQAKQDDSNYVKINNAGVLDIFRAGQRLSIDAGTGVPGSEAHVRTLTPNIDLDLGAGDGSVQGIRIKANGNVGIGTTSPGQKLSVAGTVESTSGGFKFPDGTTQATAASAGTGQYIEKTASFTAAVNSRYVITKTDDTLQAIDVTLPATAAVGDFIEIVRGSNVAPLTIKQNDGQRIKTYSLSGIGYKAITAGVTSNLKDVFMADASTGWAVGDSGTILKTTNGGETWTSQTSGATTSLKAVSAVSTSVAWIAGGGGAILKTTNGGGTWTNVGTGTSDFEGVAALSDQIAYVSDANNLLFTTNGGTSWSAAYSGGGGNRARGVSRVDGNTIVYIGGSGPVNGDDRLFERVHSSSTVTSITGCCIGNSNKARGFDTNKFIYMLANGNIVVTTNRGGTFTTVASLTGITDLKYESGAIIRATGTGSKIWDSSDSGLSWTTRSSPTAIDYYGASGVSGKSVVVGDTGKISINTFSSSTTIGVNGAIKTSKSANLKLVNIKANTDWVIAEVDDINEVIFQ